MFMNQLDDANCIRAMKEERNAEATAEVHGQMVHGKRKAVVGLLVGGAAATSSLLLKSE
jgi:hypothetical protein